MKFQAILTLLPLFFAGVISAQPQLKSDVFNQIGDVLKLQPAAGAQTEGPAGANQNWDFSGVVPQQGSAFSLKYIDPAQAPQAGLFPLSNLATEYKSEDQTLSYGFFKQNANELWFMGAASGDSHEIYDNLELLVATPINFGQKQSDIYSGTLNHEEFSARITASKSTTYDAYGSLKTPAGYHPLALRTRTEELRKDSVGFPGGAYVLNITDTKYFAWFVPNTRGAVLEVRFTQVSTHTGIPGFPPQVSTEPVEKTITYQLQTLTDAEEPAQNKANISVKIMSANPVADGRVRLEVQSDTNTDVLMTLMAENGQILRQNSVNIDGNTPFQDIDLNGLPAGNYWISVMSAAGIQTEKVIKL